MDGLDVPHANEQGMVMGMDQVDVSAGQKRPGSTPNDNTPRKKNKTDQGDDEEIQVSQQPTAYPQSPFPEGTLMQNSAREPMSTNPLQSPYALRRQDGDQSFDGYDVNSQGRKTGRMTGAKGYSLQEIQALFNFIRQKVCFV